MWHDRRVRHNLDSVTVYLVRHASAGSADHTNPDDLDRPLDAIGIVQARTIADLLASEPLTKLVSSPAVRCTQTLGPLAASLGLEIELAPDLVEGTDVDASWATLVSAAQVSEGQATALCSHGDIIPELISRARNRGMMVPGRAGFSKGSIWTLTWDGTQFTTGHYRSTHPVGSPAGEG